MGTSIPGNIPEVDSIQGLTLLPGGEQREEPEERVSSGLTY